MQLRMNLSTDQLKNCWAFAANRQRPGKRFFRHRGPVHERAIITACSREARLLGIKAGMKYEEAKARIPELKVLVYQA